MQLHSEGFNIISTVGSPSKVAEIELDLVPALVQSHGHGADERLHPSGTLVIRGSESSPDVLIIQDLHLEGEVFLQVLDDHH